MIIKTLFRLLYYLHLQNILRNAWNLHFTDKITWLKRLHHGLVHQTSLLLLNCFITCTLPHLLYILND